MRRGYSHQFNCPSVIIDGVEDTEKVIAYARAIGATYYGEGDEDFVIDFQNDPSRLVGPEIYSEEALRSSLRDISRLAGRTL